MQFAFVLFLFFLARKKLILKLKEQFSTHNELISNPQQPISTV